jgi:hypothetical protein
MKRSIFPLKSVCLLSILTFMPLSMTAQKKGTVAYSKKINGNDVVICPVKKVTDTIFLKLSSIVESCEFVKLETSPEAFFDRGWHTEISDKYICIKSYGQLPAKLYNKNGNFLRNIGAIGRGPGEYPTLNGLQFNQKGDMLFLLPFGTTRKILVYDISGNHLKDIPLAFTQRKFKAYISPDSIITVLSMPFETDSAICFQQNFKGKLIQKVSPPSYLINRSFDGEVFTNYLTPEFDMYNTATDTLYHYNIKKNTLEPKFAKDYGDRKVLTISREIPGYYYFLIRGEDKVTRMIIVNQKTMDAKYFRLKNDFFGNIEMAPVFSNGYFIGNIAAITLKNQIESALKGKDLTEKERQKLIEFNKTLKIDDNNIIFYGKLKKNYN